MSPEIGHWILNENHEIVKATLMEWARWFEAPGNKIVERTPLDDYVISTVFLGLDHRWGGNGPPILFETMVFLTKDWNKIKKGKRRQQLPDQEAERYCTWDEAKKGHRRFVWKYRGGEVIEGGGAA